MRLHTYYRLVVSDAGPYWLSTAGAHVWLPKEFSGSL